MSRLDDVLSAIRSLALSGHGTSITAALTLALDRIAAASAPPSVRPRPKVVLVTDGAGNVDTAQHHPLAEQARSKKVRIYTFAICNRRDDPNTYDRRLLGHMAR